MSKWTEHRLAFSSCSQSEVTDCEFEQITAATNACVWKDHVMSCDSACQRNSTAVLLACSTSRQSFLCVTCPWCLFNTYRVFVSGKQLLFPMRPVLMLLFETLHIAAVILCIKCISAISVLSIKIIKTSKTTTKRLFLAPMDWCPSCTWHLDGTAPPLVLFCWFVVLPSALRKSQG